MRGVVLLKVRPAQQHVAAIVKPKINGRIIRQLVGSNEIRACELGLVDDFPIRFVGPVLSPLEASTLPRWRFQENDPIAGACVLFGANWEGKAAECPISVERALELIEWLCPVSDLGGAVVE